MINKVYNCDYSDLAERMRGSGIRPDLCITSPPYDVIKQRPLHGQPTGIRDSDGRMIHEGDNLILYNGEDKFNLGHVRYSTAAAWFSVGPNKLSDLKRRHLKIVGRREEITVKQLRHYEGYSFDPHSALLCIFDTLCPGGVLCWNEGFSFAGRMQSRDAFRRPDQGAAIGFDYLQTLIYHKASGGGPVPDNPHSYLNSYELVHVFGKPSHAPYAFSPLRDRRNRTKRSRAGGMKRDAAGKLSKHRAGPCDYKPRNLRHSVWGYATGNGNTTRHEEKWLHTCEIDSGEPDLFGCREKRVGAPALMPWKLARDLLRSYSRTDKRPLVWDPFGGAGTVPAEAARLGYDWIMSDISPAYCGLADERIRETPTPL